MEFGTFYPQKFLWSSLVTQNAKDELQLIFKGCFQAGISRSRLRCQRARLSFRIWLLNGAYNCCYHCYQEEKEKEILWKGLIGNVATKIIKNKSERAKWWKIFFKWAERVPALPQLLISGSAKLSILISFGSHASVYMCTVYISIYLQSHAACHLHFCVLYSV